MSFSTFAGKPIDSISFQDSDDDYVVYVSWFDVDKYGVHPAIAHNWPVPTKSAERQAMLPTVVQDYGKFLTQQDAMFSEAYDEVLDVAIERDDFRIIICRTIGTHTDYLWGVSENTD